MFREIVKYTELSNQLEVFDISLNFLEESKCVEIISSLPEQIKELNLGFNYVRRRGEQALAAKLSRNFSLQSLNLQESHLENIESLCESLKLAGLSGSLKYINLSNNRLDGASGSPSVFFEFVRVAKNL